MNLQPEEVNAHSAEGPGDMGCQGVRGSKPTSARGTSQAPTVPPAPSQAASASERMNVLLLASDWLGPGRVVPAKER